MEARRRLLMQMQGGGLPSIYQKVEWVKGNNCNIDLQYVPKVAPTAVVTLEFTSDVDRDCMGFPTNTSPSYIIDAKAGDRWYNRYGSTHSVSTNPKPQLNVKNQWSFGRVVYCDGVAGSAMTEIEPDWSANSQSFHLFGARTNHLGMIVYDFKLYDGSSLVRDLIPCYRKTDIVIGMYDAVTKTFFINSASGTFEKGNDI